MHAAAAQETDADESAHHSYTDMQQTGGPLHLSLFLQKAHRYRQGV